MKAIFFFFSFPVIIFCAPAEHTVFHCVQLRAMLGNLGFHIHSPRFFLNEVLILQIFPGKCSFARNSTETEFVYIK